MFLLRQSFRSVFTTLTRVVVGVAVSVTGVAVCGAQEGPFVEVSGDWMPVSIGQASTTWRIARVTAGVQRDGVFGWTLAGERQQRRSAVDLTLQGGGFRRLGDWTIGGTAATTPAADFTYRYAAEGVLSRRVIRGLVLQGGYRHLRFQSARVAILQPGLTYYFRRAEIEGKALRVASTAADRAATVVMARGSFDVTPRLRLSGGGARGGRLFDIAALPNIQPDGWVLFGSARVQVAPFWSVTAGFGGAQEDPLFSQRTFTVGLRRAL